MKKNFFNLLALSAAFSLLVCQGYAKIEFIPKNGIYSLKGTNEIYEGNMLSVEISNGENVYHASYVVPDNDGNFDYYFSLDADAPAVEYSIKVSSAQGALTVLPDKFSHATPDKKDEIILMLNNASDINSAKNALAEIVKYAMASYPEGNVISFPESWTDKMQNAVYDQIKDYNEFTLNNYSKVINEMYAVSAISNAVKANVNYVIENYKEEFAFDTMTSYYNIYVNANQSEINALFLKNEFKNMEEVRKVFKQIVVLYVINSQNAPAEIVRIINDNKEILPSEVTNLEYEEKLILAGKILDDLQNGTTLNRASDLVNYIPSSSASQRPGGATTSTSGSGSSSGGGSKISLVPGVPNTDVTSTPSDINKISFADVNNASWARDAIENLVRREIIKGYDDGDFRPNNYVTREEFVKIIVTAFDIGLSDNDAGFKDVAKDFWAYKYINAAKENLLVSGISENEFGVGQNITRQDMALIILNALSIKEKNIESSDEVFTDDESISNYAKDAVYRLKKSGIIKGYEDNTFKPYSNATRAEAAQIIYNVLKMLG